MKKINLPILPATLFFICTEEEYEKYFSKLQLRDAFGNSVGYPGEDCAITVSVATPGGLGMIVVLGAYDNLSEDRIRSILTHEAVHVKQFILDACNEDKPGNEVEAYLVQYYTNMLMKAFNYEAMKINKKKQIASSKKKAH